MVVNMREFLHGCTRTGIDKQLMPGKELSFFFQEIAQTLNTEMEIQHFSHEHPLVLGPTEGEDEPCNLCSKPIDYLAFICSECGFLLHKKCARLPREVKLLPPHPQHTLVLIPDRPDPSTKPGKCGVCEKTCRGSVFRCSECDYNVEVSCFLRANPNLSPPLLEKSRKTDHFTHQHSLILRYCTEKNPAGGLGCRVCEKPVSGPAYFCPECPAFSLHKSCKFPEQIQHPFHPSHPLTLLKKSPYRPGVLYCDACRKSFEGFVFNCKECFFDLDLVCASRSPSLKHDKHDKHPLEFFEQISLKFACNVCGKPSGERIYRCVPCNFNVHSTCLPFPSTVKHRNHQHPLSLKESITKGDSGWFPCEVCKKGITPNHRVYYCEPCGYGVHIECVDSEVTPTLGS